MFGRSFSTVLLVASWTSSAVAGELPDHLAGAGLKDAVQQVVLGNDQPSIGLVDSVNGRPSFSSPEEEQLSSTRATASDLLHNAVHALHVMQSEFYQLWIGTWPSAIDWTAAVTNTHVSALLGTLARSSYKDYPVSAEVINRYFSQSTAYYFGEDAFAIRMEAYDDMLWVVLGWLESIKSIEARNATHDNWYGTQFIPGFAHRARVFYDLAAKGWDTSLCGGGMVWNPRLTPYKNAITNQLYIAASVQMYLHFPGDDNDFPFSGMSESSSDWTPARAYDPRYLQDAISGYAWLKGSNMTNFQGLYVDGFHITDWGVNNSSGTGKCDERNEMVYTYNQGVVLSGLRGLWEATGNATYLKDGYSLIRNTINATGWMLESESPHEDNPVVRGWQGLGANGILEETCDSAGNCSQDSQTFKGIYFHHLAQFCEPLPLSAAMPGKTFAANRRLTADHRSACQAFSAWAKYNAEAALTTRNSAGEFGMWWGYGSNDSGSSAFIPMGAADYRNNATLLGTKPWSSGDTVLPARLHREADARVVEQKSDKIRQRDEDCIGDSIHKRSGCPVEHDLNDRGRGRTVETQGGGLAVLRAAWELLKS